MPELVNHDSPVCMTGLQMACPRIVGILTYGMCYNHGMSEIRNVRIPRHYGMLELRIQCSDYGMKFFGMLEPNLL